MRKVHFSSKDQVLLFKQLGLLLQGGVSLLDAMRIIQHNVKTKKNLILVRHLSKEVERGRQLSQALLLFSPAFDYTAVTLIELGETSGTLAESLLAAANELQRRQKTKKKIIGALIYPAIVISATGGVIGLLVLYVFPKILPVFDSVQVKLPLTTRLLITANSFIRHQGWHMPVFILTLVLFSWPAFANKRLKKIRDRALLILPFIGSIVRNYILANFCGTLGKLLQKQVPIVKAVVMTANATRHTIYKQRVIALSVAVHRGQSLTQFLETEPVLFPPVLRQLVAVGEKTGTLGDNLIFLSHLYEQEISDVLTSLSIILEPAMMITLGGIVGFVAISIITPIYQITQNLHV